MTVVMGYDPGSLSGGMAVQQDGVPLWIHAWRPTKKSTKFDERLVEFDVFCGYVMANWRPNIVTLEVIRVSTSHDTTRALSQFEAAFKLRAYGAGARVIEYQVGQSRAAFFGEGLGSLQKEQAYAAMRSRYPDLPWLPADGTKPGDGKGGGMDQADALVPALCWEQIEARKAAVLAEKKAKNARRRARPTS